jgi:isopentenyl diphosphate isomerase/L-lactate dehydrogenase-like FMN-dependent dehydrogenase
MASHDAARRRLLQFLVSSPFLAEGLQAAHALGLTGDDPVITSPSQALNIFDFEAAARQKLPPAHWGYLATGVDDEVTIKANRDGFSHYSLRVRRMVDVRTINMGVTLFGTAWDSPIVLAPVSSQKAFHAEGEIASARAAKARNHLQILSTVASTGVEEVMAARGAPIWYQLYATDQWTVTEALLKRVHAAGCPVLVVTVDLNGGSNRETVVRGVRSDRRDCSVCHDGDPLLVTKRLPRKPMFSGIDVSKVTRLYPFDLTWTSLERLRQHWPGKLVIKGIVTREDAELAVKHGVDGLIVSNHGGRAEESGRATIDSLVEVVEGTRGRMPVLVDGGFRRGTDIFKALALGATAVCIGRPYVWGLAAFGQEGVEAVLDLMRRELALAMRQAGTRSISEITRAYVVGTPARPGATHS